MVNSSNKIQKFNKPVALAWGTFDLIHAGHREFLRKAAKFGDLYVIVIPDQSVRENKGYAPVYSEHKRVLNLLMLPYVKGAFVDSLTNGLEKAIELKPDYFFLGYDQTTQWEQRLRDFFNQNGHKPRFIRLKKHASGIHSRHLRKDLSEQGTLESRKEKAA